MQMYARVHPAISTCHCLSEQSAKGEKLPLTMCQASPVPVVVR